MSGNTYMNAAANYSLRCNHSVWSLPQAQALGVDVGSVVRLPPSTEELVAMGHAMLEF
jgi:hypothetical protein